MYMHVNDESAIPQTGSAALDLRGTGYCASLNFRRTTRAITRMFDMAFQQCGLRSTQFTILVAVAKTQPTSINSLADVLVIDSTTLTRSLRLLVKEGLLNVSKRSTMRQRFVSLTPAGEQALARSLPAWREAQKRFVQAVGQDYWLNLRSELEKLAGVVVELDRPPSDSASKPPVAQ
jgi:DNA-binding MarR family transcriptional regulator